MIMQKEISITGTVARCRSTHILFNNNNNKNMGKETFSFSLFRETVVVRQSDCTQEW